MSKRSEASKDSSSSSSSTTKDGEDDGFLVIAEAPPKLLEARQHGKTVLECSASGNPAPQITWYKDGQPLIKEVREGGESSMEIAICLCFFMGGGEVGGRGAGGGMLHAFLWG